jgi:hypothetical protein
MRGLGIARLTCFIVTRFFLEQISAGLNRGIPKCLRVSESEGTDSVLEARSMPKPYSEDFHRQSSSAQGGWCDGCDRSCGCESSLFAPYSPDLNPIEQLFSKLKERTIPRLLRKIRLLLRTVSADECLNFLRHTGYVSI